MSILPNPEEQPNLVFKRCHPPKSRRATKPSLQTLPSTASIRNLQTLVAHSQVSETYTALILFNDAIPTTAEKISSLVKAANLNVESYWPSLFAKICEKRNIEDLILNVGDGGGGAAVAVAAPVAAAAPAAEKKEESDNDMGFGLFD